MDDVSIVCENEDINAEKDVKVKLALLTSIYTFLLNLIVRPLYSSVLFQPMVHVHEYQCCQLSTVSPPSYGWDTAERGAVVICHEKL